MLSSRAHKAFERGWRTGVWMAAVILAGACSYNPPEGTYDAQWTIDGNADTKALDSAPGGDGTSDSEAPADGDGTGGDIGVDTRTAPDTCSLSTWYRDRDGDGYGAPAETRRACEQPDGWVGNARDCDDRNPDRGPTPDTDGDGRMNCRDDDDDGDGISDTAERSGAETGFRTDPQSADTDGDGVDDGADPAPTVRACNNKLLFHDDFEPTLAPDWTTVKGSWSRHQNGFYQNTDPVPGAVSWIGSRSWRDYVVRFRIRLSQNSGDAGLGFRTRSVSENNNGGRQYYLGLYPDDDRAELGVMDGGWRPKLGGDVAIEAGKWHRVFLAVAGERVRVAVDGTSVIDGQVSTYDRGAISLRSYENPVAYDDVIVCR